MSFKIPRRRFNQYSSTLVIGALLISIGCTQTPLLTKAQATYWSTIPPMSLYVALRSVRH